MSLGTWTGLCDAKTRPLTEDESKFFINAMMASANHKGEMPAEMLESLQKTFVFAVMEKRLEMCDAKVDPFLLAFVSSLCDSPGKAVLWAWTLAFIYVQIGSGAPVEFAFWTTYFPTGVPTEEELRRIWDEQKAPGKPLGNTVDDPDFWPKAD